MLIYEARTPNTDTPTQPIIWKNHIIQCNYKCRCQTRHMSDTRTSLIRGVSVLHITVIYTWLLDEIFKILLNCIVITCKYYCFLLLLTDIMIKALLMCFCFTKIVHVDYDGQIRLVCNNICFCMGWWCGCRVWLVGNGWGKTIESWYM